MTPLSRATVLEGGRENFLRERRCVARRSRRLPWRVTFSERSLRKSVVRYGFVCVVALASRRHFWPRCR